MKKVLFLTLFSLSIFTYSQEVTFTLSSIHYGSNGYYSLKPGPTQNFYRLVNGDLVEGSPVKTSFNSLNVGAIVNYKNWLIGGYRNSYYRFSMIFGRNIPLYKDKLELNLGVATGYRTDNIKNCMIKMHSNQFNSPGFLTPMYSVNLNLGDFKIMMNHFFTGVGVRVDL